MNQAEVRKLVSALRIKYRPRHRNLQNPKGPPGRLEIIKGLVTKLVRDERIEHSYHPLDEARGYAERLVSDAVRYGDCHIPTMDMANFWLKEKQQIHKLFKVLVPRFKDYDGAFTSMHKAPCVYPARRSEKAILELKGNPFPPVRPFYVPTRNWIHNILLEEAKRAYNAEKK